MQSRKWSIGVFLVWMLAPNLGACSSMHHFEWTEDVKLSDGRMMVVKRTEDYRRIVDAGAGFQQGWLLQKSSITAELPTPIKRKVFWEGSLFPLVLDIQSDHSVYLVCVPSSGAAQTEWKVPDHEFYVSFRLTQDNWRRIPLADLPTSVQPNLAPSGYEFFIRREMQSGIHVDLKMKSELNSRPALSKHLKTIIRLPAPTPKK